MRPINFILFIFSLLVINACQSTIPESDFPLDHVSKMSVTNIFRKDSVTAFYNITGDSNKELAKQYLKRAAEVMSKDQKKADYYYKRALTLYPHESIYTLYGDVLFEKEKYEEAHAPYRMAVELNPAQPIDQYIKIIKNDLLSKNDYGVYTLLDNFKNQQYGMDVLNEKIIGDEKIKAILSSVRLRDLGITIRNIWGIAPDEVASEQSEGASFTDYVKQFDPVTLPFTVSKKELQRFTYERSYEGEYDDYDPTTDFSRFNETELFKTKYYCKTDFQYLIKEIDGLTILIHAVDSSGEAVPGDFRCISHRLLVYKNTGELIDSRIIGVHSGEKLITYKITPDLTIYTEIFSRTWKKPFVRYEIDNEILSIEKTGTIQYKITETGQIVELPLTQ